MDNMSHLVTVVIVASWLPSDLLETLLHNDLATSHVLKNRQSPGLNFSFKDLSFTCKYVYKIFKNITRFRCTRFRGTKSNLNEKVWLAQLQVSSRRSRVCSHDQFIANEHMDNILSHVIARGETNIMQGQLFSKSRAPLPAMQTYLDHIRRGPLAFWVYNPHQAYLCTHC
jgi:hypothetical protein